MSTSDKTISPNLTAATDVFTPNLKVNWTETDMSAYLQFVPDSLAARLEDFKWGTMFSDHTFSPGVVGTGPSYHWVSLQESQKVNGNGSNMTGLLSPFIGTGISFVGDYSTKFASALPPVFKIDSSAVLDAAASTGGPLRVVNFSLPWGAHIGVLTTVNGYLRVDAVTWELGIQAEASQFSDVPFFTMPFVFNGSVNPGVTLGNGVTDNTTWAVKTSIGDPPTPYTYLHGTNMDNALFDIPANTALLTMTGAMGPEFGWGTFLIDPTPPGWPASKDLGINQFFALNSWYHPNSTLLLATLDPSVKYQCLVQAGGGNGVTGLGLERATFYSSKQNPDWSGLVGTSSLQSGEPVPSGNAPTNAPSSKPATSVIVGAVIGGLGGVIIAAAVGWYIYRLKRRARGPRPGRLGILDEAYSEVHDASGFVVSPMPPGRTATPEDTKRRQASSGSASASASGPSAGQAMSEYSRRASGVPEDAMPVSIVQAADGGRFVQVVPPQYDPRWRESVTSDSSMTLSSSVPREVDKATPPRKSVARKRVSDATTELLVRDASQSALNILDDAPAPYSPAPASAPYSPRQRSSLQLHNPDDPRRVSTLSSLSAQSQPTVLPKSDKS